MRRVLIITMLAFLSALMLNEEIYAQNPMREQRREVREEAELKAEQQLMAMLKSKNFMFMATEIEQTININLQNIQLKSIWGIWVSPGQFKAYLPIYGATAVTGMPTLRRRMDFTTSNYTYDVQQGHGDEINVTMTATDVWSSVGYTFVLTTSGTGQNSTLYISSPFKASVTFSGYITTNNEY
ncbi:MAG: DUF4251 domain-containing protein [Rikenellaceae bacterium]